MSAQDNEPRRITVPVLARVEGEGALELVLKDDGIRRLQLRIYEPPRMFEKFLEGRSWTEVPDMVARICGICPVAYQMSAVHALESIFGMEPGPWVREMRRLIYCGEWIESHSLHIHLLAAPDFLGFASAPEMAQRYPDEVRRGLELQALGNDLISLLGGRSVHPVGVRVGGFFRAPPPTRVEALLARVRQALPQAEAMALWVASLARPDDPQTFTTVALRHAAEYPFNAGNIVSSAGLAIPIGEYTDHFREEHLPHSTALYAYLHDKPYLVGPLARLNLNLAHLPEPVTRLIEQCGIPFPSDNMFHSVVARAVEVCYALHEAARILERYQLPEQPFLEATPRAGVGYGCTEAPRGILWHRYQTDARGRIVSARIIPPTSQNQARIEEDLRNSLLHYGLQHTDDELRLHCEKVIRNYDPCISCATHFLRLHLSRE